MPFVRIHIKIQATNMRQRIFYIALMLCLALGSANAKGVDVAKLKSKVDVYLKYVEAQPDWLVSRLQMYWKSHATDVFINGESFDHAGGDRAPVATVKFNGTRGTEASYHAPKLENVVPYDDDDNSDVTYIDAATGKQEKAHPSKTGCNIASLNRQILGIARDAASIYHETGDKRYAQLALPVFDTYLKGIYYRNVPTDLNHGHQQTLVSMTTFEVIHEDAISEVTQIYTLLGKYITKDRDIYDSALKKWAENIIANGVPHNNWDLFQAEFIANVALALQDNSRYADGRGQQYYLDYIMNQSSIRQWSMKRLADFGFDPKTAIWYESPGYSSAVLGDFSDFANTMDQQAGIDVFRQIPVLTRAVMTSAQYLFPNRMIAGFGDTHPNYLSNTGIDNILKYAVRHKLTSLADSFHALKAAVQPDASAQDIARYVSPSFYAPNVSWVVQRTGMDVRHDLMISLNGSLGNHQHANGISMELYGKGYVLGPDAGIGKYLYSGFDYSEYYSQFPAHNTVCVDGISSYPVMMSHHPFKMVSRYPDNNDEGAFPMETYTEVSFLEPESNATQLRTNGIVKTSATGGYYVDIFRSRKVEGGDKFHDYFYHNLGQTMTLTAADGTPLDLQPSDEPAFAGGHLNTYSYIYNKECSTTVKDIKATFTTQCGDGRRIDMTMWMAGDSNRKILRALSPANLEYERMPNQPYKIGEQPVLTFIARQQGEAWTHPFVAVFEPSDSTEPSEISSVSFFKPESADPSAVGICVKLKSGRTDYIFSSADGSEMTYQGMTAHGAYAVVKK